MKMHLFLFYVKLMLSFGTNENYDELSKSLIIEKIESGERNCDIKYILPFKLSKNINCLKISMRSC